MRIETGSTNLSRIPGQFVYVQRNGSSSPVEPADPVIKKVNHSMERALEAIGAQDRFERSESPREEPVLPDLYTPARLKIGSNHYLEAARGRFLDFLA